MSINLVYALNSFNGFRGAELPSDPTNQEEFSALVNAVDGGSCWKASPPTWKQVQDKINELDAVDAQKVQDKMAYPVPIVLG